MQNYRVMGARFSEYESELGHFSAKNDAEAKRIFRRDYKSQESLAWENLRLLRIIQVEKLKMIAYRNTYKQIKGKSNRP